MANKPKIANLNVTFNTNIPECFAPFISIEKLEKDSEGIDITPCECTKTKYLVSALNGNLSLIYKNCSFIPIETNFILYNIKDSISFSNTNIVSLPKNYSSVTILETNIFKAEYDRACNNVNEVDLNLISFHYDPVCNTLRSFPEEINVWAKVKINFSKYGDVYLAELSENIETAFVYGKVTNEQGKSTETEVEITSNCNKCEKDYSLTFETVSDKNLCNEGQPYECVCTLYKLLADSSWDISYSANLCNYNTENAIEIGKIIEEDLSNGNQITIPVYRKNIRNIEYRILQTERDCITPVIYYDPQCHALKTVHGIEVTATISYICDEQYRKILTCIPASQEEPGSLFATTTITTDADEKKVLSANIKIESRCSKCEIQASLDIEDFSDEELCLEGKPPACTCFRYKVHHHPNHSLIIVSEDCVIGNEGTKTKSITKKETFSKTGDLQLEDWKTNIQITSFEIKKVIYEDCEPSMPVPTNINIYYDEDCHAIKTTNEVPVIAEFTYSYIENFTQIIVCLKSSVQTTGVFLAQLNIGNNNFLYENKEVSTNCESILTSEGNIIDVQDGKINCNCNCKNYKIFHGENENITVEALKGTVTLGLSKTEKIENLEAEFSDSRQVKLDNSYVSVTLSTPDYKRFGSDDCPQSAQYNSLVSGKTGSFVWNNTLKTIFWTGVENVTATVPYTAIRKYSEVTACSKSKNGSFIVKNGKNTEIVKYEPSCNDEQDPEIEIIEADETRFNSCRCTCNLQIVFSTTPNVRVKGVNCTPTFIKDVVIEGEKTETLQGNSLIRFNSTYYDLKILQKNVVALSSITTSLEADAPEECDSISNTVVVSQVPVVGIVTVGYKRKGKLYEVCLTDDTKQGVLIASAGKTVTTTEINSKCEKEEAPEKVLDIENVTECDCTNKIVAIFEKNCNNYSLLGHNLEFVEAGNYTKTETNLETSFNGDNFVNIGYFDEVFVTKVYSTNIDALATATQIELICNQNFFTNPDIGKFYYDKEKGNLKLVDGYKFWGIVEYETQKTGKAYKISGQENTKGIFIASYEDIFKSLDIDFSCENKNPQISIETISGEAVTDCKCQKVGVYSDKEYSLSIFNGTFNFVRNNTDTDVSYSIMTSEELSSQNNPAGGICTHSIIDTFSIPVENTDSETASLCYSAEGPNNLYSLHIVQTKCVKTGQIYQVCTNEGTGGSLRFPDTLSPGGAEKSPAILMAYFLDDEGKAVTASAQIESHCDDSDDSHENVNRSISIDSGGRGFCIDDGYTQYFTVDSDISDCACRSTVGTVSCNFKGYRKRKKVVIVTGDGCTQIAPADAKDVTSVTIIDYVGGSEPLIERAVDQSYQLCPRVVGNTADGTAIRGKIYGASEIRYSEPYSECVLNVALGHSDAQIKGKLIVDCVRQLKGFNVADFTAKCEKEVSDNSDVEIPLHLFGNYMMIPKGLDKAVLGANVSVFPNFKTLEDSKQEAKLSITTKEGKNLVVPIKVKTTLLESVNNFKIKEVLSVNNEHSVKLKSLPEQDTVINTTFEGPIKDTSGKDVNIVVLKPGAFYTQFNGFQTLATFTDETDENSNDTKLVDFQGTKKRVKPNELVFVTSISYFKEKSFAGIDNIEISNPQDLDLTQIAVPISASLKLDYTTKLGKYEMIFDLENKDVKGKDFIYRDGTTVSYTASSILNRDNFLLTLKGTLSLGNVLSADPAKDVLKLATAEALGNK